MFSLMLIRRGRWSDPPGCFVRADQLVYPTHCDGTIVTSGEDRTPFTLFLVYESWWLSALKLFSAIQLSQSSDIGELLSLTSHDPWQLVSEKMKVFSDVGRLLVFQFCTLSSSTLDSLIGGTYKLWISIVWFLESPGKIFTPAYSVVLSESGKGLFLKGS